MIRVVTWEVQRMQVDEAWVGCLNVKEVDPETGDEDLIANHVVTFPYEQKKDALKMLNVRRMQVLARQ
jgi:hypothetical protein